MNRKYHLKYLTDLFYQKYTAQDYPEIEHKKERPKFKHSDRDTKSSTGLDYSKTVVLNDESYIGDDAVIDNKEYVELNNKYFFIIRQFENYLRGYRKYAGGEANEFESKKYRFSTLKYFHKEIGLSQPSLQNRQSLI